MKNKRADRGAAAAHTDAAAAPHTASPDGSPRVRPGKFFMILLPLLLVLTIGASVAPVAGEGKGWAYYRHNNIA